MLQCSPSLQAFVHLAAVIWLNVGALTLLPFTTTRQMSALSGGLNWSTQHFNL
jgi:hypothetical protein